ncbi:MAG TPA: gas vesicle protein GvpG [Terriglobales bacterium]|jgi:hypothetical protein
MFVVDDLLMAPAHGLFWIFREIHQAAQEELVTDAESITAELSALYMRLETGKLTEEEFGVEEKLLLERLDKIPRRGKAIG